MIRGRLAPPSVGPMPVDPLTARMSIDVRARLLAALPDLNTGLALTGDAQSRWLEFVCERDGQGIRFLSRNPLRRCLRWGIGHSSLGACVVASSDWGLVQLLFIESELQARSFLLRHWPDAHFERDDVLAQQWLLQVFRAEESPLPLHLRGTPFQLKVWRALFSIPYGFLATYGQLATCIGSPKSARAVGQAVGANPLAVVVPCHRVIPGRGKRADHEIVSVHEALGGYRGGVVRKHILLAREAATLT